MVGFGNVALLIQQNYHQGDRVILVGRLSMNTIERPEGFKEKRAEMTVQQIHHLDSANDNSFMQSQVTQAIPVATPQTPSVNTAPPVAATTPKTRQGNAAPAQNVPQPEPVSQTSYEPSNYPAMVEEDIPEDDIPFVRPVYSKTNWGHMLCDSYELEANSYWGGVEQIKP